MHELHRQSKPVPNRQPSDCMHRMLKPAQKQQRMRLWSCCLLQHGPALLPVHSCRIYIGWLKHSSAMLKHLQMKNAWQLQLPVSLSLLPLLSTCSGRHLIAFNSQVLRIRYLQPLPGNMNTLCPCTQAELCIIFNMMQIASNWPASLRLDADLPS